MIFPRVFECHLAERMEHSRHTYKKTKENKQTNTRDLFKYREMTLAVMSGMSVHRHVL